MVDTAETTAPRRRLLTCGAERRRRRQEHPQRADLGNLSKWALLLGFAGVGLNFDLREFARSGVRPLVVAALGLVVVAACSLGLVLLTSGWLAG